MNNDRDRVVALIRSAFAGVTLGEGVGLRQARGLDDYADAGTLAKLREQDEKEDWSRIPIDDLNQFGWFISFFDDEGMRFHMPAFVLADLAGKLSSGNLIFQLTYDHSRMRLFDEAQRAAVREFLWLRLKELPHDLDCPTVPLIEDALLNYWGLPDDFSK